MSSSLYLVNLPHNCTDNELKDWVESHGFHIASVRIIRDVIAGVSPAFAYAWLQDDSQVEEACAVLNGNNLRTWRVMVSAAEDEPKRLAAIAGRAS
jgi:RNA recognition motif-containing protein